MHITDTPFTQAGVIIIDVETRTIEDINDYALKLLDHDGEMVIGQVCHEFICPRKMGECPILDVPPDGNPTYCSIIRADGAELAVDKHVIKVMHQGKAKLVGIFHEIDQQEQETLNAGKMKAIGELAAGIAHEITSPAQYVSDNLLYLKNAFDDLRSLIQSARQAVKAVERNEHVTDFLIRMNEMNLDYLLAEIPTCLNQSLDGMDLVNQIVVAMRDVAHPGGTLRDKMDINRIIEKSVTITRNYWKTIARMELKLADKLPPVCGFPSALYQMMINLITNAADAIKEKDKSSKTETERITIETSVAADNVEIRISDTGCGMTPDVQMNIFKPFFTTKAPGKGTGQGLAFAHQIVTKKQHGTIQVHSKPNMGTTFILRLPMAFMLSPIEAEKELALGQ